MSSACSLYFKLTECKCLPVCIPHLINGDSDGIMVVLNFDDFDYFHSTLSNVMVEMMKTRIVVTEDKLLFVRP